jgi:glycosyltransferase involved in cell wall biosynthesis
MQSDMPEQMKKHRIFRIPLVQALLRRCEAWLIKRADFIACSGGLEPQIRRVRPDVPVREWRFPGQRRCCAGAPDTVTRESLGIPSGAPVVCYAGNFEHYQGVDLLVQGAEGVLEEMPEAVFLLLGAEEGEPLPRGAGPLVASGSMKVLSRKPRETVPRYLALADVTVSPRCVDGNIPLKIFDYMVSGTPMVATDIACHRSVLGEDKAVLVEASGEGMARGILRVLRNREEASALGQAARTHAEEHLSWMAFSQDVARLHEDVVRLHKSGPAETGGHA